MMPKRKTSPSRAAGGEDYSSSARSTIMKKKKKKGTLLSGPKEVRQCSTEIKTLKSRIRELGPICKSRVKEELITTDDPSNKVQPVEAAAADWDINDDQGLWLSSQSLSPLYKFPDFRFMSPREYSLDDRLISFLSSRVNCKLFPDHGKGIINNNNSYHFFDGCKDNPIKEASLTLDEGGYLLEEEEGTNTSTWLQLPWVSTSSFHDDDDDLIAKKNQNLNGEMVAGAKVSLINLEGNDDYDYDSEWISSFESLSDFPSPSYKSMIRSTAPAYDGFASELLYYSVGSMDLDQVDLDEPLLWPFNENKNEWKLFNSNSFCPISPRKGTPSSSSTIEWRKVNTSSVSINLRLHHPAARRLNNIVAFRRLTTAPKTMKFKHGSSRKRMNVNVVLEDAPGKKVMIRSMGKRNRWKKNNLLILGKKESFHEDESCFEYSSCDMSSSYGFSTMNESGNGNSSATTTTAYSQTHSASSSMDFDTTSLWVSLINLKEADNYNQSSQYSNNNAVFAAHTDDDHLLPSADQINMDVDDNQPLFWPTSVDYDPANWSSTIVSWSGFCLSPPRTHKYSAPLLTSSTTTYNYHRHHHPASRLLHRHHKYQSPRYKSSSSRRIVVFGSKLTSKITRRSSNAVIRKLNSMSVWKKQGATTRVLLNKARIADAVMENIIINADDNLSVDDTLMGLHEFDGHEGITTEFDKEGFSLTPGVGEVE